MPHPILLHYEVKSETVRHFAPQPLVPTDDGNVVDASTLMESSRTYSEAFSRVLLSLSRRACRGCQYGPRGAQWYAVEEPAKMH
jgi:hypothetical protein